MVKATARVRRDGVGGQDPGRGGGRRRRRAAGGRRRCAGGRADHRGELAADRRVGSDRRERAGLEGRRDAAGHGSGSRRSVRHGVHAHPGHARQRGDDRDRDGSRHQVGKIAGMLASTTREQTPLTRQLNTLTLWIAGAAGITMVIMFVLGASRGLSATVVFTSAIALAIAAIPEAMPTVLQVILSLGAGELATHGAVLKDLASVETLGSTSAINSDKTGTLTMNQMTAVEVVDPTDRYTISGSGYELEGKVHHAAGTSDTIDDAILPYVDRQRRHARRRQGRRRSDRGGAARARPQGRARHRGHAGALSAPRDAAVRSDLQADGRLHEGRRRVGRRDRSLLRQGRGAGGDEPRLQRAVRRCRASRGTRSWRDAPMPTCGGWRRPGCA